MKRWVASRHRAIQGILGGVVLATGVGLEFGLGWALIVLGGLLLVDLAKDVLRIERRKR